MFDTYVFQEMKIHHNGKTVKAWETTKKNGYYGGELSLDISRGAEPVDINIECDLARDEEERKVIRSSLDRRIINSIYGVCRWEGAEPVSLDYFPE